MSTGPNFELLKDAYQIIGGIPGEIIDLNHIVARKGKSIECGTICCAMGWLGMHPKFQALGVKTEGKQLRNHHGEPLYYQDVASKVFGISHTEARELFGIHFGPGLHKTVLLRRMKDFLRRHGQLKEQLEKK